MKHSRQALIFFMGLFLLTQIIGLGLMTLGSDVVILVEGDVEVKEVVFSNTTVGERPDIEGEQTIIAIVVGVFIGTVVLLLLAKFNKINIWKYWFFFAAVITMSVSFGVLTQSYFLGWVIAFILAAWKIFRPGLIIHNLTEIFIYPGIALLLAPLLNVFFAIVLLVLISIYDAYAVWRSKHMVKMAKFAKSANLFPGISLTYGEFSGNIKREADASSSDKGVKKEKVRSGILGGGDIAFPLIFASVFFVQLLGLGFSNVLALSYALLISLFSGLALLFLFLYGKKDRYYPAMPFISAGCLVGYFIAILIIAII